MLKLARYLKPFIFILIMCFCLLYIQAMCELAMPDKMSDIVNVGILQSGIETAVPKQISVSQMNRLKLFLNEDQIKLINDSYKLSEDEKYSEAVLELSEINDQTTEKLNDMLVIPMMIVFGVESSVIPDKNDLTTEEQIDILLNMSTEEKAGIDYLFNSLAQMPAEQRMAAIMSNMPNSSVMENADMSELISGMGVSAAVPFIKYEYERLGVDVFGMQLNFLLFAGLNMLLFTIGSMAATISVAFLSARLAAKFARNVRRDLFQKVESFSNVEFDKFSTASLITRTTNDVQQVCMFVVMMIRIVMYSPIMGVGGVIRVLNSDASMAWIIALAVAVLSIIVIILFTIGMPKLKLLQKTVDKLNLVTRQILSGLLVIRAFNSQKHEEENFDKVNKDFTKINLFVSRVMTFMMPLMMLIFNCVSLLIIWVGSHQVDMGNMQVGNMMAFTQYAMQILMSFLMISMISIILPRASVSSGRISEVLYTDVAIKDPVEPKMFAADQKGIVEFRNVSFKYPNAEEYVLKNINFTARPGETTAIIGGTGSGKSTLINLIPRFYEVTEGEIFVDGVNVKDVTQKELRDIIGYIPQKGVLFSGTIESNLLYGKETATDEELVKAIDIAQATEIVENKPEKYQSPISEGGTNVSGGQKQRLSIARALVKNPEIYIFDDSFSALDFKTDKLLRKALESHTAESTQIIVAQRIGTIKNAEQIIVLDNGKIADKGTHEQLMSRCEIYREIALTQLSKEELA